MSRAAQIILYGLLLIATILSANWFYHNFSWVNEQREVGFQGIAKTNQLLAAEFFLRKMGIKVEQTNGLTAFRDLPSTQYTILIATQRETIHKELSRQLLDWVKAGGHVIVEARYFADYDEDITESSTQLSSGLEDELLKNWSLFSANNGAHKDNADIPVLLSSGNNSLEVNFPYNKSLISMDSSITPLWEVKDDIGQYIMQFTFGQGMLTVLTSSSMFKNKAIADYDHAQFLHYLLTLPGHNAGVWLVRVDDMPPLWQWLWQNAWYAMLSLSALFLFWLWRAPFRFGPVLNDVQTERRSLMEHIRAAAYYRWHNDQSDYLLLQVQNRLWQHIKKSHPAIPCDDHPQACKILAELSGIDIVLIEEALLSNTKLNKYEFTEKVQLLELIRQRL